MDFIKMEKGGPMVTGIDDKNKRELSLNLERLHTTELGIERIKKLIIKTIIKNYY